MVRKGTPWVTLKYINVLQCTKQSFKFLVFHSISEDIRKQILCKSDTDDAGYHYTLLVDNIEAYKVKSQSYTSDNCWWKTVWKTRTSVRLGCHWASPAQYFFDRVHKLILKFQTWWKLHPCMSNGSCITECRSTKKLGLKNVKINKCVKCYIFTARWASNKINLLLSFICTHELFLDIKMGKIKMCSLPYATIFPVWTGEGRDRRG